MARKYYLERIDQIIIEKIQIIVQKKLKMMFHKNCYVKKR